MRTLAGGPRVLDTRTAKPPPKRADADLLTASHQAWRMAVLRRAGYQCEAIERGQRCPKRAPAHRLFADHIIERQDGGELLSLSNGQALCSSHHVRKTNEHRAKRTKQGY